MSAWYIFTCLGFYPVCPASDYYVIGAPQIPKAVMHLSNGKTFTMTAEQPVGREHLRPIGPVERQELGFAVPALWRTEKRRDA